MSTVGTRISSSTGDGVGPSVRDRRWWIPGSTRSGDIVAAGLVSMVLLLVLSAASGQIEVNHGYGYDGGFFVAPTVLEGVSPGDEISRTELFGPITCLYRVRTFDEAIAIANESPFGLTASVHTQNLHRAMTFLGRIQAGVAVVNGGTYGSEPHLPFGGLRQSGNGWREAGTQALDVYSDLKTIYINHNPQQV